MTVWLKIFLALCVIDAIFLFFVFRSAKRRVGEEDMKEIIRRMIDEENRRA